MEKWKALYNRYRELILYVVFGGLTTLVSFVSYWIFVDLFHIYYMAATVLSWIVSVTGNGCLKAVRTAFARYVWKRRASMRAGCFPAFWKWG